MSERKEAINGDVVLPEIRRSFRKLNLEKGRIWDPQERGLLYRGIEGKTQFYYDGIDDILVFNGFLPGREWEKLKKSLRSLRRKTDRGSYEVIAKKRAIKAKITLFYADRKLPKTLFPEERFEKIWQDLVIVLPKKPGLVALGRTVKVVKEFNLQDLLVGD